MRLNFGNDFMFDIQTFWHAFLDPVGVLNCILHRIANVQRSFGWQCHIIQHRQRVTRVYQYLIHLAFGLRIRVEQIDIPAI